MTILERSELLLIYIITMLLLLFDPLFLPNNLPVSYLLLYGAVVLLLQGLLRDLCIIFRRRLLLAANTNDNTNIQAFGQPVKKSCLCLESLLGLVGVVVGLYLLSVVLRLQ